MAAGTGNEVATIDTQAVADEAGCSIMSVRAGDNALVAAGALVQIQNQHALGFF